MFLWIAYTWGLQFNIITPGGGVLGPIFAGYVPLASPNPYAIIVYFVANHRPHLSHFWAKSFSLSQLSHLLIQKKIQVVLTSMDDNNAE